MNRQLEKARLFVERYSTPTQEISLVLSQIRGQKKKTAVVHCKRDHFDVYIGRPSKWGNPFSQLPGTQAEFRVATRSEAIAEYEDWLRGRPDLLEAVRTELRGKVLGCWCAPLPCHGDVLARIANECGILK